MSLSSWELPHGSFPAAVSLRLDRIVLTPSEEGGGANPTDELRQHLLALAAPLSSDCHSLSPDECVPSAGWGV